MENINCISRYLSKKRRTLLEEEEVKLKPFRRELERYRIKYNRGEITEAAWMECLNVYWKRRHEIFN